MELRVIGEEEEFPMIGRGNTAEIYKYSEDKVLKLLVEQMPFECGIHEYEMAKIVNQCVANAPVAYELVRYHGRVGIIYEYVHGTDLVTLMFKEIGKQKKYIKLFTQTHVEMHRVNADVGYSVKKKLSEDIARVKELTEKEKKIVLDYLDTLPDEEKLCHFDYHPGNVLVEGNQSYVIDWMTVGTGDPCADVARTQLLLRMGEPMNISRLKYLIARAAMGYMREAYLKEYCSKTGVTREQIFAWELPVAAARLSEMLAENERKELVQFVLDEIDRMTA